MSCGGADQKRSRSCIFPDPENKGEPCDVDNSSDVESRRCNEDFCSGNKKRLINSVSLPVKTIE